MRHPGIWRASRSIVLFGDWPPETSPGGTPQANYSNKTVKSMVPDERPLEGDRHPHNDFTYWILVALLGSLARQWNRYVDGDVLPETLLMKGRLREIPINIVILVL